MVMNQKQIQYTNIMVVIGMGVHVRKIEPKSNLLGMLIRYVLINILNEIIIIWLLFENVRTLRKVINGLKKSLYPILII